MPRRKEKRKATELDEGLILKAKQLKVEPDHEAILDKAALNAGLTKERYLEYIKGLHKERFEQTEESDPSVLLAKQLQAEFIEEEKQALREEQQRVQADQEMSQKIAKEQVRLSYIQKHFIRQRWEKPITHLEGFLENGKAMCKCFLENSRVRTFQVDRMYTLGLEEWKQLANMAVRLKSDEFKVMVKQEAFYNVNAASFAGLVDDDEFREFCIAHNCHKGAKSLGLESQADHPVPSELTFKNRTYIKTNQHEGLFFVDSSGAECFQDINSLFKCSLYHCIALLNECKKERCKPFRLRLIRWLFNNLLRIKKIGGVDDKVEEIQKEYQIMFNKSDQEMKQLMKWKEDRTDWVKSNLKPSIYQASPRKKTSRRRR